MPLRKIEICNFRCLEHVRAEFDVRQNLILGSNAAGKTSVLEAIYTLGSGHSFRSMTSEDLIQSSKRSFSIAGSVSDEFEVVSALGMATSRSGRELSVNGGRVQGLGEFASRFPVQVIDPDVHRLIEDGPSKRRRFIDWGSFHVEHGFKDAWRRFNRVLGQRNAALKQGLREFDVWDAELLSTGGRVTAHRESYLRSLTPFISELGRRLLGSEVETIYTRGWSQGLEFEEALKAAKERDIQRGLTTVGPQRAELQIRLDGSEVKDRVSRGQQKLIACILVLAQQLHCADRGSRHGCLLLDDPAAELDVDNLGKLFEIISDLRVQLIATSLSPVGLTFLKNPKVFHVERGMLNQVA